MNTTAETPVFNVTRRLPPALCQLPATSSETAAGASGPRRRGWLQALRPIACLALAVNAPAPWGCSNASGDQAETSDGAADPRRQRGSGGAVKVEAAAKGEDAAQEVVPPPSPRFLQVRQQTTAEEAADVLATVEIETPVFHPNVQGLREDLEFFREVTAIHVGQEVSPIRPEDDDERLWTSLGFVPVSASTYRREADLTGELADLVPTNSSQLSEIDSIAIVSVDRSDDGEPYLYRTLRSLFAAFPPDVQVNVLVGNADARYVAFDRLADAVGADNARRVHAWPTSEATANFLRDHLEPSRRGGWNTVRSLRSYRGSKGLLLMEDDIIWAEQAIIPFNDAIKARPVAAFSLYNNRCQALSTVISPEVGEVLAHASPDTSPLIVAEVDTRVYGFDCMQAVYYAATLPGPLGRYTHRRMHTMSHDCSVGRFFTENEAVIGYPFPSLVQHIGTKSAYHTWAFHYSPCFRERL